MREISIDIRLLPILGEYLNSTSFLRISKESVSDTYTFFFANLI